MSYIKKPLVHHPSLTKNKHGLTVRDYEGPMSTLCAGCGHDSITAAIVRAFWEAEIPPHLVAKLSGIGCSSKRPRISFRERMVSIRRMVVCRLLRRGQMPRTRAFTTLASVVTEIL